MRARPERFGSARGEPRNHWRRAIASPARGPFPVLPAVARSQRTIHAADFRLDQPGKQPPVVPGSYPALQLLAGQRHLEPHSCIVAIGPFELAAERRQVRQAQEHVPELADRADRPQLRAALGNIMKIAGIMARSDADSSPALEFEARKLPPLWRNGGRMRRNRT